MKSQSVATIREVCRGNFQASFKQLSTRLNIYNLIASAASDVQERIIAQVDNLKADGQELYKRKRKTDDEGKGEKGGKRTKHTDAVFQAAETPGTEMDLDLDQTVQCVISQMNEIRNANLHQKCSGRASVKFVHEGSRNRCYERAHKRIHKGDGQ